MSTSNISNALKNIARALTTFASQIITGIRTPGGYLGTPSLTTPFATKQPSKLLASVIDVMRGGAAPTVTPTGEVIRHPNPHPTPLFQLFPVAEAAERVISTTGMGTTKQTGTASQVPKSSTSISSGVDSQVLTAVIPGQVSPTPVASQRVFSPSVSSGPTIPTPSLPARISTSSGPVGASLTSNLVPPTGTAPVSVVPGPAAPASIVQREPIGLPISEIVKSLMEAQKRGAETKPTVELPMPEPIEARARPRTLEEILVELLTK